ncbi:MAG: tRNA (adenosine(37)-N6)-dimethylallyltransferase MiaA [Patescibacteria group bacterium]
MIPDTNNLPMLIVILGPTASGKTDLATALAKKIHGEIVNADSRQIYKEIDIASAKPKFGNWKLEIGNYQSIPHHLFNVVKPNEDFNVSHFQAHAFQTINNILARKKLPFLVGGTGLWISAVVDNFIIPNVPPRKVAQMQEAESLPTQQLYEEMVAKDPNAAAFINAHNRRRIMRALEVMKATGKPFSAQRKKQKPRYRTLLLGLTLPMETLEKRIALRVDAMMRDGLLEESKRLLETYDHRLPALSSISLREWKNYFDGTQTLPETLALIRLHNRQYAKRQMTWFKKDKRICWIKNKDEAVNLVNSFLHS